MRKKIPKKTSLKKKVLTRGLSLGLAAATAFGAFKGKQHLDAKRARVEMERKQRIEAVQKLHQNKKIRNPRNWARLCEIYAWNPAKKKDALMILKLEQLSKRIGVAPPEIIVLLAFSKGELERGEGEKLAEQAYKKAETWKRDKKVYGEQINFVNIIYWANSNPNIARQIYNSPKRGTAKQLAELRKEWK